MTPVRSMLLAAMLLLSGGAGAQTPATPPAPTAATVDEGKKFYTSYGCYQCHGHEGQGSSATGPRIGPRPLPLASFTRYVRRPTGVMPPYTPKVVSDAELEKIHAYLVTRPVAPPIDAIPLLR